MWSSFSLKIHRQFFILILAKVELLCHVLSSVLLSDRSNTTSFSLQCELWWNWTIRNGQVCPSSEYSSNSRSWWCISVINATPEFITNSSECMRYLSCSLDGKCCEMQTLIIWLVIRKNVLNRWKFIFFWKFVKQFSVSLEDVLKHCLLACKNCNVFQTISLVSAAFGQSIYVIATKWVYRVSSWKWMNVCNKLAWKLGLNFWRLYRKIVGIHVAVCEKN